MYCKNCGTELKPDASFCKQCGQKIVMQRNESIFGIGDTTKNAKATTGLVLGIIGLIAWFIPVIGAPITIIGLIFSIRGLKSLKRGVAIAGIILSSIGLFVTIVNASIGAYQGATGQNWFVNKFQNRKTKDEAPTKANSAPNVLTSATQDEIAQSVVNIYCPSVKPGENGSRGSGVIISEDGWIITNSHIIPQDKKRIHVGKSGCLVILPDATTGRPKDTYVAHPIVVREFSDKYDLAYLKIDSAYYDKDKKAYVGVYPRKFPIFDTTKCGKELPKLGDSVRIYGYPEISGGYSLTITDGIVSSFPGGGLIVTSAKVSHGNSGGLAVDRNGCWIGIPSMVSSDERESLGVIISKEVVYKFSKEVDAYVNKADTPATKNPTSRATTNEIDLSQAEPFQPDEPAEIDLSQATPVEPAAEDTPENNPTAINVRNVDNGDGTISDNKMWLMWQQGDDDVMRNWNDAQKYCSSLDLGGYFDWRVPTINELESIVDKSYTPTIDNNYFKETKSGDYGSSKNSIAYWSSTKLSSNDSIAWEVLFQDGTSSNGNINNINYIRCVRYQ